MPFSNSLTQSGWGGGGHRPLRRSGRHFRHSAKQKKSLVSGLFSSGDNGHTLDPATAQRKRCNWRDSEKRLLPSCPDKGRKPDQGAKGEGEKGRREGPESEKGPLDQGSLVDGSEKPGSFFCFCVFSIGIEYPCGAQRAGAGNGRHGPRGRF